MHILHAIHPTATGAIIQIFHARTAAETFAKPLLQEIGNALVQRHDDLHAEEHPKAAAWEAFKRNIGAPFVAWSTFVEGLDDRDEEDRDWFVEISERTPRDEPEAPSLPHWPTPSMTIDGAPLHVYGAREEVQPLDPADLVVSTLVGNLASIVAQLRCDEQGPELAEAVERVAGEGEKAIEAGQAWLDKARPVGRIADDVVRLAGIIVAGTDLHACLSEAIDVHIYDADQGEAPDADCGYAAALKGWTEALAGITVTTPAPAAPVWDAPEIAIIMEGGCVQNIVTRNEAPVIVHIVDYDTEGGDETDIVEIPQSEGKTAGAFLQCYDGKLDTSTSAAFWKALRQ